MTDGLRVPFLTRSGVPTGVYYSITQCRSVGLRPTTRLLFGLEVFDSLLRRNLPNRIQRSSIGHHHPGMLLPTTRFVIDQASRVEPCRAESPRFVPTDCLASASTRRPTCGPTPPGERTPGPQRASPCTPRLQHRGFDRFPRARFQEPRSYNRVQKMVMNNFVFPEKNEVFCYLVQFTKAYLSLMLTTLCDTQKGQIVTFDRSTS
jgi:hypothetical protein